MFVARKGDRKLQLFLWGDEFKGTKADRPLAHATIIHQIRVARDAEIWLRLGGENATVLLRTKKQSCS